MPFDQKRLTNRNAQLMRPGYRKKTTGTVHQDSSNGSAANQSNQKVIRRGPYKLTPQLIERFVESIKETGGPICFHCQALGVAIATFYEWRSLAEEDGTAPIYREFAEAIDRAMGERLKVLYAKAEAAKPHQILFRQYPHLFPRERTAVELSGLDGGPIAINGGMTFNVLLELHEPGQQADESKRFTIVQ